MSLTILTAVNAEKGLTKINRKILDCKASSNDYLQSKALVSEAEVCKRCFFAELPIGLTVNKAFAARRQICVVVSGRIEISSNSGDLEELGAGAIIRLEDTNYEAPGRVVKVIGDAPAQLMVVQLN